MGNLILAIFFLVCGIVIVSAVVALVIAGKQNKGKEYYDYIKDDEEDE